MSRRALESRNLPLLQDALRRKDAVRRELQKKSFADKIRILIAMQKQAKTILKARGKSCIVWPDF